MIRDALHHVLPAAARQSSRTDATTPVLPVTVLSLAAVAALAPAYVVRWHVGPLPTTLLETAVLLTIATFGVESLRSGVAPGAWVSPLTLPAALFLVAGLIAVLASPSHVAALGTYRAYLLEPAAVALVVASAVRTPRQAALVVGGLCLGASTLALANAATVLQALRHHQVNVAGVAPVAIYLSPNSVALFLVPLVAVAGAVALHGRGWARAAAGAFLVVAVPASLLTFSRGGWAALAAVTVGLALSHRRRWWLLAGLAAAAAAALIAVPGMAHRLTLDFQSGPGNTLSDRVRLWSLALRLLSRSPLLGTGLDGFKPAVVPLWHGNSSWILYAHNLALDLWTELGLLGLLSFAWFFGAAAFVSWRGWRRGVGGWRPLHLGVLLALLAVLVHGMVDNPYFKNDLSLELWALVALSWAGWHWGGRGVIDTRR